MSEIQINGRIVARVIPQKTFVVGSSSLLHSELIFNFPLTYMPYLDDSKDILQPFKFDEITGEVFLYLHGKREKIGNLSCKFSYNHFIHGTSNEFNLNAKLDLDLYKFKKIEELRKGDIEFDFRFETKVTMFNRVSLDTEEVNYIPSWFTQSSLNFTYTIPLSVWIKQIIPKLNFGNYELFEVPIPDKAVTEELASLTKCLESARSFFDRGDYPQVVSECRKVLEHIPTTLKIDLSYYEEKERGKHSTKVQAFVSQHLGKRIQSSKQVKYIENRLIHLYPPMSSEVHSLDTKINRFDSEIILYDTVSILSYIGKVLKFNVLNNE